MRATDFITEAPLPDDWDQTVYKKETPFSVRVQYAKERAQRLGSGSSRVAFVIDYKGRQTVLKIAKNKKGIAQNEAESLILSDGYLHGQGKMVPIIDYDTQGHTWIHCELAQKATVVAMRNYFQLNNWNDLIRLEDKYAERANIRHRAEAQWDLCTQNATEDHKEMLEGWVSFLHVLRVDFGVHLGDFDRIQNWGFYQGHPVILDVGFTEHVHDTHYR